VLIADADQELCDLYRRFFSHHRWQVRTSRGGLECLTQLLQSSPQLLILDHQLPWGGVDGVLAVMRDDPDLRRVPVILTSTEGFAALLPSVVSPPVVRALCKPFSLTALLDVMRSALEQEQPLPGKAPRPRALPGLCS
jgi:DNA-binding NtrC family response regulator